MYRLFYAPGTAAMAPQTILEEAGAPYELLKVDLATQQNHQPEYLRYNPTGRVPTLVDGDFVMYETAAICQYLIDRHPEARLAPPIGSAARGRYYQWLTYMTNTVQVLFLDWFHADWVFNDPAQQAALKAAAAPRLYRAFDVLNAGMAAGAPTMLEDGYSACDIYLTMLGRWSRFLPRPMWEWPNLKGVLGATYRRPAFQRMMQKQGIGWADNWPGD